MMAWFIGLWLVPAEAFVDSSKVFAAPSVRELQRLVTNERERQLLTKACRVQLRTGLWPSACRHEPGLRRQMEAACLRADLSRVARTDLQKEVRFFGSGACRARLARRLRILEYREQINFGPELE